MSFPISYKTVSEVKKYLEEGGPEDYFILDKNFNINFHWANWESSLFYFKNLYFNDGKNAKRFLNFKNEINELKMKQVWMRDERQQIEVSLYELYEFYLNSRVQILLSSFSKKLLVSLQSPAGPFVSFDSLRWMNKETFELLVFKKILEFSRFPLRNLRLGASFSLDAFFENDPLRIKKIIIHQFSKEGFTLKIKDRYMLEKLSQKSELSCSFSDENCELDEISKIKFKLSSELLEIYGNKQAILKIYDGFTYLFCPYSQIVHETLKNKEKFESFFKNYLFEFEEKIQDKIAS